MNTPTLHRARPQLIGLCGYAGTGKDTVRGILEQDHTYTGMAFAEPIRGMLRELFTSNGIDPAYMDERDLKEAEVPALGVSYRQLAQTLGTEWGRNLQPDFWLRIASAFMDEQRLHGAQHFVVSDVRFVNEAQWVRENGGVIWRIHRPDASPVRAHVSEQEIDQIEPDLVIDNSQSVDALWAAVDNALHGEMA